jgi:quercetin dioxygenase-like cupin family protein
MRLFNKSHDGGKDSGVTAYFLVEIKPLFSIVLLKFSKGTRDAFHNHAFNALTIWLKGNVIEHMLTGEKNEWKAGNIKYTPRSNFHKVEALTETWALCIRGPWKKNWNEFKNDEMVTLTNGRVIVDPSEGK